MDALLLQQGIAAEREFEAKKAEWELIRRQQAAMYVDLTSDEED